MSGHGRIKNGQTQKARAKGVYLEVRYRAKVCRGPPCYVEALRAICRGLWCGDVVFVGSPERSGGKCVIEEQKLKEKEIHSPLIANRGPAGISIHYLDLQLQVGNPRRSDN